MIPLKRGQWAIACVCAVLGFMLAVQLRTAQDLKSLVPNQRIEELSARLQHTEEEKEALQQELAASKNTPEHEGSGRLGEDIRRFSTLLAVDGQGIVVTIDDSKKASRASDDPNLYLVHDEDLLKVVNELRAAGAEAISINGQRLTALSEIRCAGPTLSVNNTRSAPPYEIKAVGDAASLENAIKMRGGVADALQVWGIVVDVKKSDIVHIPAYKGSIQMKYAKTAKEGDE